MPTQARWLAVGRVCTSTRYARLTAPLLAAEDEEDGRRIIRMDESGLRVAMGAATAAGAGGSGGASASVSQFDPQVYGSAEYRVVVPSDGMAGRGGASGAQMDMKLWVNVKSSDSDSVFVSVDGSDFMSWHVNSSDGYQWRKFWRNVPLSPGAHTITLGFKYPQMYVAHVWLGNSSFQPDSVKDDAILHSDDEQDGDDPALQGNDVTGKLAADASGGPGGIGSVGSVGSVGGGADGIGVGGAGSAGGSGRGRPHVSRASSSSLRPSTGGSKPGGISMSALDPDMAKFYIISGDGTGDAAGDDDGDLEEEKELDPLSQSYAQYAEATAPQPRAKTRKRKKKKEAKAQSSEGGEGGEGREGGEDDEGGEGAGERADTLLRNELSKFSFNAGSRPTTPMGQSRGVHPASRKSNMQRPRTLQDFMARSSFQERKVLREHDRRRAALMNKRKDVARFATFAVLARSFELEQAFRFKQRERAIYIRQEAAANARSDAAARARARRSPAAGASAGSTTSSAPTVADITAGVLGHADLGSIHNDDERDGRDRDGEAAADEEGLGGGGGGGDGVGGPAAAEGVESKEDGEGEGAAGTEKRGGGAVADRSSGHGGCDAGTPHDANGEAEHDAFDRGDGGDSDGGARRTDDDAADAWQVRLALDDRPPSAPAGETVFGRKYYTEDQKRRHQLRALPGTVVELLVAGAHRRTGVADAGTVPMPLLGAQMRAVRRAAQHC